MVSTEIAHNQTELNHADLVGDKLRQLRQLVEANQEESKSIESEEEEISESEYADEEDFTYEAYEEED